MMLRYSRRAHNEPSPLVAAPIFRTTGQHSADERLIIWKHTYTLFSRGRSMAQAADIATSISSPRKTALPRLFNYRIIVAARE